MSVAEITSAIDRLSPPERAAVLAHLHRRFVDDTPERRRELARTMREMDAGKKYSLEDVERRISDLEARGE